MPGPTRRELLVAVGGMTVLTVGVVSCTSTGVEPGPTSGPTDPDAAVRDRAVARERALAAAYAATVIAHPELEPHLTPLGERHPAYAAAMAGPRPAGTAPETASAGASAPATPPEAVAALRSAEAQTADAHVADCGAASDAGLARVLALAAAGCAGAAGVLGSLR